MTHNTPLDALREARLRTHDTLSMLEDELGGHLGIDDGDGDDDQNAVYGLVADLRRHIDRLLAEQAPVSGIVLEHPAHDHPAVAAWTHSYDDGSPIRTTVVPRYGVEITRWTRDPNPEATEQLIAHYSRPTLTPVVETDI